LSIPHQLLHHGRVGEGGGISQLFSSFGATVQGILPEQAAAEHEESHIALEEWVDPFKGWEM